MEAELRKQIKEHAERIKLFAETLSEQPEKEMGKDMDVIANEVRLARVLQRKLRDLDDGKYVAKLRGAGL